MKTRRNAAVRGLLLDNGWRKAGSMLNPEGKTVSWESAYKLTLLPLEESKSNAIRKFTVAESAIDSVDEALANVHWGALISVSFDDGKVCGVVPELDLLESIFDD